MIVALESAAVRIKFRTHGGSDGSSNVGGERCLDAAITGVYLLAELIPVSLVGDAYLVVHRHAEREYYGVVSFVLRQIGTFDDPLNFQKKLRSVWQHQQNVTYCMFGSKMHMMESMFSNSSCPLYKFGDILFLKKIPTKEWVSFITSRFSATGKTITEGQAEKICNITDNLSSYVQQMAWIVWYKANPVVTDSMIDDAVKDLLEQNKVFFQRDVESLTELQLNFIVALADGVETGLTKNEVIRKYHLQTSANVQGIKKSLMSKEFIDNDEERIYISDPIFKLWINRTIKVR